MKLKKFLLGIAIFLAAIVLLLLGLVRYLASDSAAEYAVNKMNQQSFGLTLQYGSGNVVDGLSLKSLQFSNADMIVNINELFLLWQPRCLWEIKICVDELSAASISLTLADTNPQHAAASKNSMLDFSLPLPLPVQIQHLAVQQIDYRKADAHYQIKALQAQVHSRKKHLVIDAMSLRYEDFFLQLKGDVGLYSSAAVPMPLQLHANVSQAEYGLNAAIDLQGDLDSVHIQVINDDALLALRAKLLLSQPLQKMQLRGSVYNTAVINVDAAEQHLRLNNLQLDIALDSNAATLRLQPASVQWLRASDQLTAKLSLHSRWEFASGKIAVNKLSLQSPAINLQAKLQLLLGEHSVDWQVDSQMQGIKPALLLADPQWQAELAHRLRSTGQFDWQAQEITHWQMKLDDGQGHWQQHGLQYHMALSQNEQAEWLLQSLNISSGQNSLQGFGQIAEGKQLQLQLRLLQIEQWLPEVSGQLTADMLLSGSPTEPNIQGAINGKQLVYADFNLETVEADFSLLRLGIEQSHVNIRLQGLTQQDLLFSQMTLSLSGDRKNHRIEHRITHPQWAASELDCQGSANNEGDWRGECSRWDLRNLAYALPDFSLQQALQLQWAAKAQQVSLAPFCFSQIPPRLDAIVSAENIGSQNMQQKDEPLATICSESPLVYSPEATTGVNIEANNLALSWFNGASEQLDLSGFVDLSISADKSSNKTIIADAKLLSRDAEVRIKLNEEKSITVPLTQFESRMSLRDDSLRWQHSSRTEGFGEQHANLRIKQLSQQRQLAGSIRIEELKLAPFAIMSEEISALEGNLNARVDISGVLDKPQFKGFLRVQSAAFDSRSLSKRVENIQAEMNFDAVSATFKGGLAIDNHPLNSHGDLHWQNEDWRANIFLSGKDVPLQYDEIKKAFISPDLSMQISPQQFTVKGKVAINNVLVEMKDLPVNAYSESADTQFISSHSEPGEVSADALPWEMSADIEVFLGDEVIFRGFGADVHLAGRLRYLQQQQNFPLGEGEISITKGRYTFWGQRLDIKEGSFLFSGPLDSPSIKLEATRDIASENLTVGIRGYGPIAEPKFDVFSSKTMSEQETMHYLLTGRGLDKKSAQGGDLLSAALLSKGVNNAGSRPEQIANKLGIEDFQMGTSSNEEGSAVQVSGYVSERIFVEYGVGLFDRTNAFILRYQLTEKLFVETASGIDSTIDLIYSFEHD